VRFALFPDPSGAAGAPGAGRGTWAGRGSGLCRLPLGPRGAFGGGWLSGNPVWLVVLTAVASAGAVSSPKRAFVENTTHEDPE
jgi:hypothetical protein